METYDAPQNFRQYKLRKCKETKHKHIKKNMFTNFKSLSSFYRKTLPIKKNI